MKNLLPLLAAAVLSVGILLLGMYVGTHAAGHPESATVGTAVAVPEPLEDSSAPEDGEPMDAAESAPEPQEYVAEAVGSIAIPGYERIILTAGQRTQAVTLENPPANDCYFVISILLPDGTELYKSGLIAPGSRVESIKLLITPEAGIYENAILRYSCWAVADDGTMQELNGADTILTLEVNP